LLNDKTITLRSHTNTPDMRRLRNRKSGKRAASQDVLVFVAQISKDLHRAPSLNEIALHLGITKTEADRKVRELIRQGILERAAVPLTRANGVPGIRIRTTAPPARAARTRTSRPG
jgi:hypothetical protein